ncbi:MAG: YhbY family RNA-binding protein [Rhodocyclales bacterium]|nr:YhbY family RNA-binding protein [Rhodocyclales bacterium]
MTELTPAQRREMRATAHHLQPVVTIAGNGLTPPVVEEIERSLQAHELIKIKVHGAERDQREELMTEVCAALGATPVQHIGTILVVWRKRREEEQTRVPAQKADRLVGDKRPSKTKSARAFSAAARRTALVQAAAAKKRRPPRGPRGAGKKTSGRDD